MTNQTTQRGGEDERLSDLLADQALWGLPPEEAMALQRLEADGHDESYELAAAALDLAMNPEEDIELPQGLKDKVLAQAPRPGDRTPEVGEPDTALVVGRIRPLPWVVAAAAILLAVTSWVLPLGASPAQRRSAMLAQNVSILRADWQALEDPSVSQATSGDVIWSDQEQEGYMRFVGLEPNDPAVSQYQLWIFDSERSAERPVDGGVFDISSSGEVVVPIDAKLPVTHATMFAITVERPGGVVVSDRSRLPLLAQVQGG